MPTRTRTPLHNGILRGLDPSTTIRRTPRIINVPMRVQRRRRIRPKRVIHSRQRQRANGVCTTGNGLFPRLLFQTMLTIHLSLGSRLTPNLLLRGIYGVLHTLHDKMPNKLIINVNRRVIQYNLQLYTTTYRLRNYGTRPNWGDPSTRNISLPLRVM